MHTSILALSHEICENKITQHLRLSHSPRSPCAGFHSGIHSRMPFLRGLKTCLSVRFPLSADKGTSLAMIEVRMELNFFSQGVGTGIVALKVVFGSVQLIHVELFHTKGSISQWRQNKMGRSGEKSLNVLCTPDILSVISLWIVWKRQNHIYKDSSIKNPYLIFNIYFLAQGLFGSMKMG